MRKFFSTFYNFFLSNWPITLILLLAGYLRLYKIADYMTFLGDEGRDVLVVYNILHGDLTLLGPTASVGGFFLGPIYYYFMTPFLFLSNYNPVGPAVMVALFGIATVWLVYKVGEEIFGKSAGLIASLLYALSPVVIIYSRSSWNPNPMPFFSLTILYLLYQTTIKESWKKLLAVGILLGILIQLHYLAVFVGFIIIIYILLSTWLKQQEHLSHLPFLIFKKYLIIGIGFIIGWSPFLIFELRHGFPNLKSILNFIFSSGETGGNARYLSIAQDVFFRLFGRLVARFPQPEQVSIQAHQEITVWYYLTLLLAISSVGVLIYQTVIFYKKKNEKLYGLLLILVWLLGGVFLFGFYKKSIYDYYFGFMFFIPFLLTGNLFAFLMMKNKYLKIISIILVIFLVWFNFEGGPFKRGPNRQMEQVKTISRVIYEKANNRPFNFALITLGNSDHAYRYFLKLWGNYPITIENTENDPQRKTVTDQLLIICEGKCSPLGNSLWEVAGFGRAEIVGEWEVPFVTVYKLVHYKGKKT